MIDGEGFVTVAGLVCAGEKMGHQMAVGNTCVPDTHTDQDDFLSACFRVRVGKVYYAGLDSAIEDSNVGQYVGE